MFTDKYRSNFKEYKAHKKVKTIALSQMSFTNTLWFSLGALLQQGGECYPRSLSGRITTVLWWFGVMIMCATYTANLAAFLTASRQQTQINSIDDLVAQTKIEYGMVRGSAPYQQMMTSPLPLYQDIGNYMTERKTLLPNTTAAVEKTREGDFAFIWDSAVLEYIVQQEPCNTVQTVGRLFSKQGYGFGLQKNSPYKEELSTYILQLRDTGFLDLLKDKWYKERGECQNTETVSTREAKIKSAGGKLDIKHMLGVFYIIYGGQVLSIIVLVMEWIVKCASAVDKNDPLSPQTFWESLSRRWKQMLTDWKYLILSYCFCRKRHPDRDDVETTSATSVSEINAAKGLKSALKSKSIQKRSLVRNVKSTSAKSCFRRKRAFEENGKWRRENKDDGNGTGVVNIQTATQIPKSFVQFPKSSNHLQLDPTPSYWKIVSNERISTNSLSVLNGRIGGKMTKDEDPHMLEIEQASRNGDSVVLRRCQNTIPPDQTIVESAPNTAHGSPDDLTTDDLLVEDSIPDDPSKPDDPDNVNDVRTVTYVYGGSNTLTK